MSLLDIAKQYLGLHEVRNKSRLKSLLGIDPSKIAWCAAFINAVLKEAGFQGTGKLTARSFLKVGKLVTTPEKGDVVVLKRGVLPWQGHVGLFVDQPNNSEIILLGGNQGNKVCYKRYPKKSVLGYRRFSSE